MKHFPIFKFKKICKHSCQKLSYFCKNMFYRFSVFLMMKPFMFLLFYVFCSLFIRLLWLKLFSSLAINEIISQKVDNGIFNWSLGGWLLSEPNKGEPANIVMPVPKIIQKVAATLVTENVIRDPVRGPVNQEELVCQAMKNSLDPNLNYKQIAKNLFFSQNMKVNAISPYSIPILHYNNRIGSTIDWSWSLGKYSIYGKDIQLGKDQFNFIFEKFCKEMHSVKLQDNMDLRYHAYNIVRDIKDEIGNKYFFKGLLEEILNLKKETLTVQEKEALYHILSVIKIYNDCPENQVEIIFDKKSYSKIFEQIQNYINN